MVHFHSRLSIMVILSSLFFISPSAKADGDKINIDDLEKKFWSSKDDDFKVIQNKAFTKTGRFFASAASGKIMNDTYSVGNMYSYLLGYYFTEIYGAQLSLDRGSLTNSETTQGFIDGFGAIPNYSKFAQAYTLSGIWVPFYGKMSFLEKKIVYFDLALSLGIGKTTYEQQVATGGRLNDARHIEFKITEHFFLNEHFAVRFDMTNQWATYERIKYHLPATMDESQRGLGTENIQNFFIQLGFTYFH